MWLKYRRWVDKTVEIRKLEGLAPEQAESVPKGSSSRQGDAGTRRLTIFWAGLRTDALDKIKGH